MSLRMNSKPRRISFTGARAFALALALLGSGAGCAKNVEKLEFSKWGNSYLTDQKHSSVDTTAQGGSTVVPTNSNHAVPKSSVGGTYHRTFATSPNYRLIGGFHTSGGSR